MHGWEGRNLIFISYLFDSTKNRTLDLPHARHGLYRFSQHAQCVSERERCGGELLFVIVVALLTLTNMNGNPRPLARWCHLVGVIINQSPTAVMKLAIHTITQYPMQSHYPDIVQTILSPILLMLSASQVSIL